MSQDVIWEHFQNEGVSAFSGSLPRLEFLVRRVKSGERVLNIGVGAGQLEMMAKAKGIDIWAVDPSERSIGGLRKRLDLGEQAKTGYSQSIPFGGDQFDVVIMTEVLEHLDEQTRMTSLVEVRRVLKPGGRLIGTVPARERLEESKVVCPNCEHHFHRWGHQATFDVNSLKALLQNTFDVATVEERFFNEWKSASAARRVLGLAKKFLSWRGWGTYGTARNIYFDARKPIRSR